MAGTSLPCILCLLVLDGGGWILKIAWHAMLDTISTSRMYFIALPSKAGLAITCTPQYTANLIREGAIAFTLIFRILQSLQPALDFLWDRRGGMF
jgi:hypothetical protein